MGVKAMTKPRYRAVGYAYPSSAIAAQFKMPQTGCWYHYTLDANYDNAGNEAGPFVSATEANNASKASHPTLTLPVGIVDWLDAFLTIDARETTANIESDHHPEDAGYAVA